LKIHKGIIVFLSVWLSIQSFLPIFPANVTHASTLRTCTIDEVNFGGEYHVDKVLSSVTITPETSSTCSIGQDNPKNFSIQLAVNGADLSANASYDTSNNSVSIRNIPGKELVVKGFKLAQPGFRIWRQSDKATWQFEGNGTGKFSYQPHNKDANGFSNYPGDIPAFAYNVTHGQNENVPGSLQSNKMAVTEARETTAPDRFYLEEDGEIIDPTSPEDAPEIELSSVVMQNQPSSDGGRDFLTVYNAEPEQDNPKRVTVPDGGYGPGAGAGLGRVTVMKFLNDQNVLNKDYVELEESNDSRLGLNYLMYANTYWKSVTYRYKGSMVITYETTPPVKSELAPLDIVLTSPSLEVGQPTTFKATFTNSGSDISQTFNVKVYEGFSIIAAQDYGGLPQNAIGEINFTTVFPDTSQREFTIVVDTNSNIDEHSENNNSLSRTFKAGIPGIAANFTIDPPSITWGDTFNLIPQIVIPSGCTYMYHKYKFTRDYSVELDNVYSQTQTSSIAHAGYPSNLQEGSNSVYLNVSTTCGDSGWVGPQTLTVSPRPDNQPPNFQIGWVYPSDPTHPLSYAKIGATLDLVLISDPTVPTPKDPDGDWVEFLGIDFTNSDPWTKAIPGKYDEYVNGYHNIVMDEAGVHSAEGHMRDQFGKLAKAGASILIGDGRPYANISGPNSVIEGRPLATPLSSETSFSPLGYLINHALDVWTNKADSYPTPGTEHITLQVTDDHGQTSDTVNKYITVLPDLPPIPGLEYVNKTIRGIQVPLKNKTYSPDGDTIVKNTITYTYDANNDGIYGNSAGESPQSLAFDGSGVAYLTPIYVGKYRFEVCAREDWGKSACDNNFILDVTNNSPTSMFYTSSSINVPFIPTANPIPISTFTGYTWSRTNFSGNNAMVWWTDIGGGKMQSTIGGWPYTYGKYRGGTDFTLIGFSNAPIPGLVMSKAKSYKDTNITAARSGWRYCLTAKYSNGVVKWTMCLPNMDVYSNFDYVVSEDGYIFGIFDFDGPYVVDAENGQLLKSYTLSDGYVYGGIGMVGDNKIYYILDSENDDGDIWHELYSLSGGNPDKESSNYTLMMPPSGYHFSNVELTYKMSIPEKRTGASSGFAFKIQDNRNMFRVEADGNKVRLVKITNAARSILQEANVAMTPGVEYSFRIKSLNNRHQVYVNGVLYLDVNDSSFSSGKIGPYTEITGTIMSNIVYTDLDALAPPPVTIYDAVQINRNLDYHVTYVDPEADPRISQLDEWYYEHLDQKFIDTGDGYSGWSAYNGWKPYGWIISLLDKVGLYRITLRTRDDPNLSYPYNNAQFDPYRQWSDPYSRNVVVFRPPIAQFTAAQAGDGRIVYNDTSYDPDRCYSNGICQAPDTTGINYTANRGILERKWYYTTPSGATIPDKLVMPTESGTYTIGLAVKNEYGGWSNWATFDLNCWAGAPHAKPQATMLSFSGDKNNPTVVHIWDSLNASWYQYNASGDPFTRFNLQVLDEGGGYSPWGTGDTGQWNANGSTVGWAIPGSTLTANRKYQMRVQAMTDYAPPSEWSNSTWIYVNEPPVVQITSPTSENSGAPSVFSTTRPNIQWKQHDPDPANGLVHFVVRVYTESGSLVYDSGWRGNFNASANNFTIDADLAGNTKYRVEVWVDDDKGDWGADTNNWLIINRAPSAHVDQYPSPTQNLTPTFTFTHSDPDPNTTLTDNLYLLDSDGNVIDQKLNVSTNLATGSWTPGVTLLANRTYQVYMTVSDGVASPVKSNVMTFSTYLNNAPTMVMVFPDGTVNRPNVIGYQNPSIKFSQNDPDTGDYIQTYRLVGMYADNGQSAFDETVAEDTAQQRVSNVSHVLNNWIDPGRVVGVNGVITDNRGAQSAWAAQTYFVVNQKPVVTLVTPGNPCSNKQVYIDDPPVLHWKQSSWNPFKLFTMFKAKLLDQAGNNWLISPETAQNTASEDGSWTVPGSIPTDREMRASVQIKDQYDWSDWSNEGCFLFTHKPAAAVAFPSGSAIAPTVVSNNLQPVIVGKQFDIDPGTVFRSFQVQVVDPNNVNNVIVDSGTQALNTSSDTFSWNVATPLNYQEYGVKVRTFDGYAWSDWSPVKYMVLKVNTPPVAELLYPVGSAASPDIFLPDRPTITWKQTDVDSGTVFRAYRVQVWNEAGTQVLYDPGDVGQDTEDEQQHWDADQNFTRDQKLRVQVKVFDGTDWSAWSAQGWMIGDRAPVADFTWTPATVWEGDTVTLLNLFTDPDAGSACVPCQSLTAEWKVTAPDGQQSTYATTGNDSLTVPFTVTGTYQVHLKVSDGLGLTGEVDRTISAQALTIDANVSHTSEWEATHQKLGHQVVTNPKDFYSGEIFVVEANSSGAAVADVRAWMDATGADGAPLHMETALTPTGIASRYSGQLYDNKLMSPETGLPKGLQQIYFRITYGNGVIREQTVPVNIIGFALGTSTVHRRQ
jgi:hypothetical protein